MSTTYATFRQASIASLSSKVALDPACASREIDHIACCALNIEPATLLAEETQPLAQAQLRKIDALLDERLTGKPLAHVLGCEQFLDLQLRCTPATLVPRPETETLALAAIELIPTAARWQVADFGTGSGALAAALAQARPLVAVHAFEASHPAAAVAQQNFTELSLSERIKLTTASWETAQPSFDLIVSNPPYVTTGMCNWLNQHGQLVDPWAALDGGTTGLDCLFSVIQTAVRTLRPSGSVLLEHGVGQQPQLAAFARQAGFIDVTAIRDLHGIKRILHARLTG